MKFDNNVKISNKNKYLLLYSNLVAKKFNNEVYSLAVSIPSKSSAEEVHKVFEKLETYNNQRVMGNYFFNQYNINFIYFTI
jgi:hypothetical protein